MVYYYSRKLVLPEYFFSAREVVNMMASKFKYNSDNNIITNTDLQYMTPHTQKELLFIIIDTYMETLQTKIKNSIGISLRSYGIPFLYTYAYKRFVSNDSC